MSHKGRFVATKKRVAEEAAGRIRMSLSGCEKPADLLTTLGAWGDCPEG